MFNCPIYENIRDLHFRKITSISVVFYWLDELCFRKETFFFRVYFFARPEREGRILGPRPSCEVFVVCYKPTRADVVMGNSYFI